jgi:hypothetical protein
MEREKSNLGLGVLIGLLIGVICFLVYFLFFGNKSINLNSSTESTNKDNYNYSLNNRKRVQYVSHNSDGNSFYVHVDLTGNAYLEASGNSNGLSNFQSKYSIYSLKGYENYEGTDQLNAFKLDIDNVLYVQNTYLGNGGFSYCIFVLENGEVSYFSYYDLANTGNVNIKKIDGLKNIVTVVSDRILPYVIDINGNEYSLSDYIK